MPQGGRTFTTSTHAGEDSWHSSQIQPVGGTLGLVTDLGIRCLRRRKEGHALASGARVKAWQAFPELPLPEQRKKHICVKEKEEGTVITKNNSQPESASLGNS